jgi:translation initiation factor 1
MSSKNTRLVYSTDPAQNRACPRCKNLLAECACAPEPAAGPAPGQAPQAYKFIAVLRLEKAGRGGKAVTVIDQLPKSEIFLRDLAKELKARCGTGGTYRLDGKEGIIEIQGDKREMIRDLLAKKAIKSKG